MSDKKIKVLIVDDSPLIRELFSNLISHTSDMQVVATAVDGVDAIKKTKEFKPDVISMDIEMPNMNGFEATKVIMHEMPTPIVVISSHAGDKSMNTTFNALKEGALTVIEKPKNILSESSESERKKIIQTLRALSEVSVVTRRSVKKISAPESLPESISIPDKKYSIVALGASTGGPETLFKILEKLPQDFPVPIVIVQHITDGFINGMVSWLNERTRLSVEVVKRNYQPLLPGNVYFADDSKHLIIKKGLTPMAVFDDSPPVDHFKPSVNKLFSSIAKAYPGHAMAGLLTGMGKDGADGLLEMKNSNCSTFIQDEKSSVVFGMPAAAKHLGAANRELSLMYIPEFLIQSCGKERVNDK